MTIAELSIKRPVTAIMFFVSLFVIGLIAAIRLPLEAFPEVEGYIALYSAVEVSRVAAAKAIAGELNPSGKLPVDIPGADVGSGTGLGY